MGYNRNDMGNNVILIGMPASGKSTAGILLAKKIGYGYIDTDLIIQNEENALLWEILSREGAEGFIRIEERVNAAVSAQRCVISTGGSAVYGERAMAHLKTLGRVVYLKIGLGELEKRLAGKDIFRRGVVMKERGETLSELLAERAPLYEKYADVVVDCEGKDLEDTVSAVIGKLGECR